MGEAAKAKAAQQVHSAEFQATQAAAEAKASQAESEASQAQLAQRAAKTAEAKAEQQAAFARSAENTEKTIAAQKISSINSQAAQKVNSAETETEKAHSDQESSEAEALQWKHTCEALLPVCLIMLISIIVLSKTKQGKAFKERMSGRISGKISGLVGRKDPKKLPLLSNDAKTDTYRVELWEAEAVGA